jgi:PhnB protein
MSLLAGYLRSLPQSSRKIDPMNIQCYLNFDGRCEEALEFYRKAAGAEVQELMRHSDSPEAPPEGQMGAGYENKVMHSSFRIGDTVIMATDGYCQAKGTFQGFSLTLNVKTPEETDRYFNALADGGQVTMPLDKTFWSPRFGMLTDRFGVSWMVHCV